VDISTNGVAFPGWLWLKDKGFVSLSHTNRLNRSRFTFVFLGLAICVFTWGLQYKLSLYDPPHSTSHQIPEAKLLSRNEEATADESPLVRGAAAWAVIVRAWLFDVFAFFLLALNLLCAPMFREKDGEVKRPWRTSCRPSLNAFFFRPPPALT